MLCALVRLLSQAKEMNSALMSKCNPYLKFVDWLLYIMCDVALQLMYMERVGLMVCKFGNTCLLLLLNSELFRRGKEKKGKAKKQKQKKQVGLAQCSVACVWQWAYRTLFDEIIFIVAACKSVSLQMVIGITGFLCLGQWCNRRVLTGYCLQLLSRCISHQEQAFSAH